MTASVIFTTYNSALWLEKVLWGFQCQEFKDFEILIADDGSSSETFKLIDKMKEKLSFGIQHIWHEDKGFRKCEILNKAIMASATDYIIFTDGDCIPHKNFINAHIENRQQGHFLSGGYFKLSKELSEKISKDDIISGRCFDIHWLRKQGLPASSKNGKLLFNKNFSKFMNAVTPTKASWNGHNSSAWKKNILSVNGFDERMKYGSEDREFGERLMNSGVRSKQIRYSAICLHLDHDRAYVNEKDLANNAMIRSQTKKEKLAWTDYGISLHKK